MRSILASSLMLSSILIPAVANASTSPDDASVPTQNLRVSTGLVAPVPLGAINIETPSGLEASISPRESQIDLSLTVDSNGQAHNVKVVKSGNPFWDARVVDAIQNSRFKPGTVDKQAVPVDMNLTVNIVP